MGSEDHLNKEFVAVHITGSDLAGGACLWGHKGGHSENSCCYRTQSHNRADADKAIYESYRKLDLKKRVIETLAYGTGEDQKGPMYPPHYLAVLDPPEPGDWDVRGPTRDVRRKRFKKGSQDVTANAPIKIPAGKNFYKDTWPYWNNAHHIVPKGTLVAKIDDETATDPRIGLIIKQALMVAKYNVNHERNMMFLPQDREVGEIIGLPRHITLMEGDGPGGTPEATDHKAYNAHCARELKTIIDSYKAKADQVKDKKHPELKADLDKTKLENLSDDLREKIETLGKVKKKAGKPLSAFF